jgi:hypothetical protein
VVGAVVHRVSRQINKYGIPVIAWRVASGKTE